MELDMNNTEMSPDEIAESIADRVVSKLEEGGYFKYYNSYKEELRIKQNEKLAKLFLDIPIAWLFDKYSLTWKSYVYILTEGIETIGELLQYSEFEVRALVHIDKDSFRNIMKVLNEIGLELKKK